MPDVDTDLQISAKLIGAVTERLEKDQTVRRTLPGSGRLHIDRQLPFLCVYRRPATRKDPGTSRLIRGQASYLVTSGESSSRPAVQKLIETVARTLSETFGAFLLLELWSSPKGKSVPTFRIHAPLDDGLGDLVEYFRSVLSQLSFGDGPPTVEVITRPRRHPPGMAPLVPARWTSRFGVTLLGLEVSPLYRDAGQIYPELLRVVSRRLNRTLTRVVHRFSCSRTTRCPVNYHMLGRRAVVKAVWTVDEQLTDVYDRFDFLLQVTPTNSQEAWQDFERGGCQHKPVFRYRPLPFDAIRLRRHLWSIPTEKIEDPTLFELFRQKQDELDRQIRLLQDLGTPSFRFGAAQIFGVVDKPLLSAARRILRRCPPADETTTKDVVDARAFAQRARREIAFYRRQWPEVDARVEVRSDIARGLMVSRGSLLIGAGTQVPASRVEALLQHEVGTHVLTYFNGRAQAFRQLYAGLAGYDPLQEGIAVLAEYLVGGLTPARLRLLAARVVAVHGMMERATFVDTFRLLTETLGFQPRTAFTITMRIYRGGGLTKDATYLRGLIELLDSIGPRTDMKLLLIGKIATEHLPVIRELRLRGVSGGSRSTPRYLGDAQAQERLERVRQGLTVLELLDSRA